MYDCGLRPNSKKMRLLFNELTLFARDCFTAARVKDKKRGCCVKNLNLSKFMTEEIINSLIQLGAAVVITYIVYFIIKNVLDFKNGGKNSKDNLSYQQATDERLDALEKRTGNDIQHQIIAVNERVDKIDNRLRKVESSLAVIRSKIQ